MKGDSLFYHSIFKSIQGEGPLVGTPSVFLRLSGCNLACSFCDTIEALEKGKGISLEKAEKKILGIKGKAYNLIVTGGEPLLQREGLSSLLAVLKGEFSSIEIETNGTLPPLSLKGLKYNVSPKLSNSGVKKEKRIIPSVLSKFLSLNSIFKFVVKNEKEVREVQELRYRLKIPKDRIFLMPLSSSKEELESNAKKVALLAFKYGFRYSDRVQIRLLIP